MYADWSRAECDGCAAKCNQEGSVAGAAQLPLGAQPAGPGVVLLGPERAPRRFSPLDHDRQDGDFATNFTPPRP